MANELITMDKPWETRDRRKVRLLATPEEIAMMKKGRDSVNDIINGEDVDPTPD